jgi:hypothetical protein
LNNLNNQGLSEVTVTSGTAKYKIGKIGQGFDLNSRVMFNCPDLSGCKKFTICFWAKIEDDANITVNWQDIIGFTEQKADNSSTGQLRAESCYSTAYAETSNSRYIHWHDNTNYAISDFSVNHSSTGEIQRNIWHHCVLVVDSESGIWAYTDGTLIYSKITGMNGGHLTGQFWLGETDKIQGVINDVRIYKDEILSPKVIKEISKGLVCHYTLSGGGGENLILTSDRVTGGSQASGITRSYESDGSLKVVAAPSNNNYCTVFFEEDSNENVGNKLSVGDPYTISVDIKVEEGTKLPTLFINNGNTYKQLLGDIKLNQWIRAYYSSTWNEPGTSYGNITLHLGFSSAIGTYYFKNFKLEKSDHPTPWTPAPTDALYTKMGFDDGIEYDVSGYGNNGTKVGNIAHNVDTPRYWTSSVFANSTNYSQIRLPEINPTGFTNSWTICAWMKSAGSMGGMVWGGANGNRLNLYLAASILNNTGDGSNNPFMNNGSNLPSTLINTGGWHFVAVTGDGTSNDLYIDGEYAGTAKTYKPLTATKYIINGWIENNAYTNQMNMSDFRIYATALSADNILALYNTPISLSSNGTLLTQGELTEV